MKPKTLVAIDDLVSRREEILVLRIRWHSPPEYVSAVSTTLMPGAEGEITCAT
jgi:hypothetical protein